MTARARRSPKQGRGGDGPASLRVRFVRVDSGKWKALEAGRDGVPVGAFAVLLGCGPGVDAGIAAVSAGIDEADRGCDVVRVLASSARPDADEAGTLHLDLPVGPPLSSAYSAWPMRPAGKLCLDLLVGPPLPDDLARRLYRDVLTSAIGALVKEWSGGTIRLMWRRGDDVASRVVLSLAPPAGGGSVS